MKARAHTHTNQDHLILSRSHWNNTQVGILQHKSEKLLGAAILGGHHTFMRFIFRQNIISHCEELRKKYFNTIKQFNLVDVFGMIMQQQCNTHLFEIHMECSPR